MKKARPKKRPMYQIVSLSLYRRHVRQLDRMSASMGIGRSEMVQMLLDIRLRRRPNGQGPR